MRVFIQDGNLQKHSAPATTEILSESFLNFSDILVQPTVQTASTVTSDEDLLSKYTSDRAVKRIDCLFMMKVNDEILKAQRSPPRSPAAVFEQNDNVISESLNDQISKMQSKLKQRKINSFLKGWVNRRRRTIQTRRFRHSAAGRPDSAGGRAEFLGGAGRLTRAGPDGVGEGGPAPAGVRRRGTALTVI